MIMPLANADSGAARRLNFDVKVCKSFIFSLSISNMASDKAEIYSSELQACTHMLTKTHLVFSATS